MTSSVVDDLREQRRVAVRHTGHEGSELHAARPSRERAEHGVALEDRLVRSAERWQLPEVVHHPDRVEPRVLRGDREGRDMLEQLRVGDRVGEARQLEPEPRHAADPRLMTGAR